MKKSVRFACGLVTLVVCLFATTQSAVAQGDAGVEAKFIAMLKNATLKGSWAPVQQGRLGSEQGNDSYRIARAEKTEDGKWSIVSVVNAGGRQVEFPIPASVKFAGDTAVLILDNVRAAPGKANWSARIMFYDDVYVGRWWEATNREHGGTIAGTIMRGVKVRGNNAPAARESCNVLKQAGLKQRVVSMQYAVIVEKGASR